MKKNSQKNIKGKNLMTRNLLQIVILGVYFLFLGYDALAQINLPSEERCTSKDLMLVAAKLETGSTCVDCSVTPKITGQLILSIDNKTGSTRTSFAFWGTLVIFDSNGNEKRRIQMTGCNGPIPKDAVTPVPFDVTETGADPDNNIDKGKITINCGESLKIINLFLAWTDASPKSTCTLDPAKIAPKCGTLPAIDVTTGLAVTLKKKTEISCAGNDGALDINISGGREPYKILWTASNGGVVPSGQEKNEDINSLVPGTYKVVVTDAEDCEADFETSLTAPPTPDKPVVILNEPMVKITLCSSPEDLKPSLEICSPVVGTKYVLYKANGTKVAEKTSTEANPEVKFTGLEPGSGFKVQAEIGVCKSEFTICGEEVKTCPSEDPIGGEGLKQNSSSSLEGVGDIREKDLTAYPVPFSRNATVEFKMPRNERYEVNLYDMKGNLIKQLKAGKAKAGELQQIEVDGQKLPEGMYLVRVVTKDGAQTVKLLKKE